MHKLKLVVFFSVSLLFGCIGDDIPYGANTGESGYSALLIMSGQNLESYGDDVIKILEKHEIVLKDRFRANIYERFYHKNELFEILIYINTVGLIEPVDLETEYELSISSFVNQFSDNFEKHQLAKDKFILLFNDLSAIHNSTVHQYYDGDACWTLTKENEQEPCDENRAKYNIFSE